MSDPRLLSGTMTESDIAIEALDLVKRFGDFTAVDGSVSSYPAEPSWACSAPTARARRPRSA